MARVRMRFFQCLTAQAVNGIPEVGGISGPNEWDLSVNLARALSVNTLATPVRGPARYATRRHEARLLACLLTGAAGATSATRRLSLDAAFPASARHIRGFVSESAGLGLLTVAAEELFRWRADPALIEHFDALPTSLVPRYGTNGSRPDLLFNFGIGLGLLAGEAKGRSRKPPTKVLVQQVKALNKLLRWSHDNHDHPIVLSFAFLTNQGTTVDLFSIAPGPRSPVRDLLLRQGKADWIAETVSPDPQHDEAIALARQDAAHARESDRIEDTDMDEEVRRVVPEQDISVEDFEAEAIGRAGEIENQLYADASQLLREDATSRYPLMGTSVVGSWMPLNLFAERRRYLFFGTLDHKLTADAISRFERGRDDRQVENRTIDIDIDITSRLVVAITTQPTASPPAWESVKENVERG